MAISAAVFGTRAKTRWFDGAAIGEADRQKIGRDNAIKLFKLKLS